MSNASTVADQVSRLVRDAQGATPALAGGQVTVFTRDLDPVALSALLRRARDGWVMSTDAVYRLAGGTWTQASGAAHAPATPLEAGVAHRVLHGELALGEGHSALVRRVGGVLRGFRYLESVGSAEPGEHAHPTEAVVWREDRLVSNAGGRADVTGAAALRYRTAWRARPEGPSGASVEVWRPWFSRFTGWEAP